MYIKNIGQFPRTSNFLTPKLPDGSNITGKIISINGDKGLIKLHDGTIIPAIFISENEIEKDKSLNFTVQSYDGESYIIKIAQESQKLQNDKSLNLIIRDLNIPLDEGKNIIMSLIKYNMPATNENIYNIYKNISFLYNIKNMDDSEIIFFLKEYLNKDISKDSVEFIYSKEVISNLKNINSDFLSFMMENDIPNNLQNMLKTQDFINNKFLLNSFMGNIKNILSNLSNDEMNILSKYMKLLDSKPKNTEKLIIDSIIKNISKNTSSIQKNIIVSSLEETINIFKENKDMFSLISPGAYKKLLDTLDILKLMNNNYSLYFFNLYEDKNILKNNIIIKNKHKGSNYIDINDVKAFISVDTKNIGTIEGSLYKNNNDISISFHVNNEFVNLFKDNIEILKNSLNENGYNTINISVEKYDTQTGILPFSEFLNDSIFKELDVKV